MNHPSTLRPKIEVEYPEDDGNPLAENTLQYEWITTIKGGLDVVFADDPDVFVAADLLWYPVEGDPTTRRAPDAMVAFGRPKGYRGSYLQWREGHVAPQVVFEVLSPGNRPGELLEKYRFYERFGAEEYYVFDPGPGPRELLGYLRDGEAFRPIAEMNGWVSPRLGVRFAWDGEELSLYGPDGRPFVSYSDLARQSMEAERQRVEAERQRAEAEHQRDTERQRAERLAERLRALGLDPEA